MITTKKWSYIVLCQGESLNLASNHILRAQVIILIFNKMTQIPHS